ncbi:MAG: hypothetical protein IJ572_00110 [Bacilli bacterium]|nr:hypothetical protein [Bacilli bacterium]
MKGNIDDILKFRSKESSETMTEYFEQFKENRNSLIQEMYSKILELERDLANARLDVTRDNNNRLVSQVSDILPVLDNIKSALTNVDSGHIDKAEVNDIKKLFTGFDSKVSEELQLINSELSKLVNYNNNISELISRQEELIKQMHSSAMDNKSEIISRINELGSQTLANNNVASEYVQSDAPLINNVPTISTDYDQEVANDLDKEVTQSEVQNSIESPEINTEVVQENAVPDTAVPQMDNQLPVENNNIENEVVPGVVNEQVQEVASDSLSPELTQAINVVAPNAINSQEEQNISQEQIEGEMQQVVDSTPIKEEEKQEYVNALDQALNADQAQVQQQEAPASIIPEVQATESTFEVQNEAPVVPETPAVQTVADDNNSETMAPPAELLEAVEQSQVLNTDQTNSVINEANQTVMPTNSDTTPTQTIEDGVPYTATAVSAARTAVNAFKDKILEQIYSLKTKKVVVSLFPQVLKDKQDAKLMPQDEISNTLSR